jgi:predicted RNase H-like HicB family nuclease
MESTMTHYIAIMAPSDVGEWRVWIPDVPECEFRGNSPDAAKVAAAIGLTRTRANIGALPLPRELIDIATDNKWMSRGDIDFTKAVVAMIPLGNTDPAG